MSLLVRLWKVAPVLALGLLLGSPGCTNTPIDTPDGGDTIFDSCSVDSECSVGFRCHRELRRCVCTSDSSCPANLFCNAFTGACVAEVPGCTSDGQCAPSQYCEVGNRTCRDRRAYCESCSEDVQCGSSADRCIRDDQLGRSFCGKACTTDADCDAASTCQDKLGGKTCWPANATCEALAGYNPDSGQTCAADADCTDGSDQVCDQVQQLCVARVPTCPFGQVCDRDTVTCTAACTTDDECNLDPDCENTPCRCTNNQCTPIALCRDNSDCEAGKVCVIEPGQTDGECGTACAADTDCPQGSVCTDLGTRRACMPGCLSSSDCTLAQNCSGGRCVTGCQVDDVCELCQRCAPINPQVNECRGIGSVYCQTCAAPADGCQPATGTQYCCDMDSGAGIAGYLGQDCSTTACPRGFQCFAISDIFGTVLAQNCFPFEPSVCSEPTCN